MIMDGMFMCCMSMIVLLGGENLNREVGSSSQALNKGNEV